MKEKITSKFLYLTREKKNPFQNIIKSSITRVMCGRRARNNFNNQNMTVFDIT